MGYLFAKAILIEKKQWDYLTDSWADMGGSYLYHGYLYEVNVIAGIVWFGLVWFGFMTYQPL